MRVALAALPIALALILGNEATVVEELVNEELYLRVARADVADTKQAPPGTASKDLAATPGFKSVAPKPGFTPGTLSPPPVAVEKTLPLEKLREVEALTKEDFVRKCVVVLGVNDDALLPTAPLEKLCRTTEHVAECREMIVNRLQQAHNRGEPLDGFCDSAYEWFQNKYGHLCANQCDKLQCKASCAWLASKKTFESSKQTLETLEGTAKADKKGLEEMGQGEKDMKDASVQNKRNVERYKVKVEKAQKYLGDADKVFTAAQADTKKTSQKVNTQEEELKKNIAAMSKLEDVISKKAHEVGMGGLKQKKHLGNVKDVEKELEEASNRHAADSKTLESTKAKITETKDAITKENSKVDEANKKLDEIQKRFAAFEPKVQAERSKYKDMKSKEAAEDELKQQLSVYHQVKQKLKDILREKKPFKDEKNKLETGIGRLKTVQAAEEENAKKIEAELKNVDSITADTKPKLAKAKDEQSLQLKELEKLEAELKKSKEEMAGLTDKRKQQEINLKFAGEASDEDKTAEAEAGKTVDAKKKELANMQQGLLDMEDAFKESELAVEKQIKAVKDAQAEFEKDNKNLAKLDADLKVHKQKLQKSKPEIVMQHKLGLLKHNATTTATAMTTTTTTTAQTTTTAHHHHHHHHHHHKHKEVQPLQQQNSANTAAAVSSTTSTAAVATTTSSTKTAAAASTTTSTTKAVATTTTTSTTTTTTSTTSTTEAVATTTTTAAHHHHHHHHHHKHQEQQPQQNPESGAAFTQVFGNLRFSRTVQKS